MITPALSMPRLVAASPEEVILVLAARLAEHGHVKPSFAAAAAKREKRSPTGLPFVPHAVALPHAEPEHVESPAIAIATLARPVRFRQMGSPGTQLDVSLVVMPALSAKEQAAASLTRVIELLQDNALREALVAADSAEALSAIFGEKWGTE